MMCARYINSKTETIIKYLKLFTIACTEQVYMYCKHCMPCMVTDGKTLSELVN